MVQKGINVTPCDVTGQTGENIHMSDMKQDSLNETVNLCCINSFSQNEQVHVFV